MDLDLLVSPLFWVISHRLYLVFNKVLSGGFPAHILEFFFMIEVLFILNEVKTM